MSNRSIALLEERWSGLLAKLRTDRRNSNYYKKWVGQPKHNVTKPPKLRFRPGTFLKDKDEQLYCIRLVYRLKKEPHVWRFILEYREHLGTPQNNISLFCAVHQQSPVDHCEIIQEPIHGSNDEIFRQISMDMYMFGDWKSVTNQELLHEYQVVSSGEIC